MYSLQISTTTPDPFCPNLNHTFKTEFFDNSKIYQWPNSPKMISTVSRLHRLAPMANPGMPLHTILLPWQPFCTFNID